MSNDTSNQSVVTANKQGAFVRPSSSFRNFIEKGGEFEPEAGRYHLYVSVACPWAHRALILRKLKGLEDIVSLSIAAPRMHAKGWAFSNVDNFPGATIDHVNNSEYIREVYFKAEPNYSGRFTVPVLWDKKKETIVNNESSEIIRIFNSGFNDILPTEKAALNFYPKELQKEIDELNEWVYETVNNGVYKTGFAKTQEAYESAIRPLFDSLDRLEKILYGKEYLVGDRLTEADVRLYTTIIRFDTAYHGIFKCNLRTIRDGYPNINKWLKNLYWNNDAFKSTTDFDHIKTNYAFMAHINPTQVVPLGPIPNIEPLTA
ncbi:hypothetical protein M422DRAFT_193280 [Sphaerobolus stellatus SS14]|uniref:GST C-terminal domain-containing protein n=1 Tax=Sphaerobolus stellatus (strain SS14) TaxID=990650 RepID=A0A0C9T974_SPHS4|nr:hypothetical protein M422DRAFT_193280 [Sphaerobolus stellatus SS14]